MAAATMNAVGLCGASLQAKPRSGFMGTRLAARPLAQRRVAVASSKTVLATSNEYPSVTWIKRDPIVPIVSLIGWSVPTYFIAVPGLFEDNASLTQAFFNVIGSNLARFPLGPPLADPFWGIMAVWHAGLFAVMLFGQIGVQGGRQGYW